MEISRKLIGKTGEDLAKKYLRDKGYKIIGEHYQVRGGEVDLIALFQNRLVFIEVKTRTNKLFGLPEEAVNKIKLTKLLYTAKRYILKHKIYNISGYQIDTLMIEMDPNTPKTTYRHYQNITGGV